MEGYPIGDSLTDLDSALETYEFDVKKNIYPRLRPPYFTLELLNLKGLLVSYWPMKDDSIWMVFMIH